MDKVKISKFVDSLVLDKRRKQILISFIEQLIYESGNDTPPASINELGGIKTGYTENGKNYPVRTDENNNAYVSINWIDDAATEDTLGLVKKAGAVSVLATDADIVAVVTKVNDLIAKLKVAGIVS